MRILKTYHFINSNGDKFMLRLGLLPNANKLKEKDGGYRWSFVGKCIPMPIRSNEWFNGFPESTMVDWLMNQGWFLHCVVNMTTGKATINPLPFATKSYEVDTIMLIVG